MRLSEIVRDFDGDVANDIALLENEITCSRAKIKKLENRLDQVALLQVVAYAAKHYVATGYEKPCEAWRQPLIDALIALSDNYKLSLC